MTTETSAPRLEHDLMRRPSLGYEPGATCGIVRCIEHGFPTPLARWHYHDEYELQLIVETSGRTFVGDYIGDFEPGHLVLTGPRLPHNWISTRPARAAGMVSRLVMQFLDAPLRRSMHCLPELDDLEPLLERARHGVEFFGISDEARRRFYCVRNSKGTRRLSEFLGLLCDLAACKDFRMLSTMPIQSRGKDPTMEGLNKVVEYVNQHYGEELSMERVYALAGMSQSTFSRSFSRATGSNFTEFMSRFRIGKACELLLQTDRPIADIAFEVGFNNISNFNRRFLEVKKTTPSQLRLNAALRLGSANAYEEVSS